MRHAHDFTNNNNFEQPKITHKSHPPISEEATLSSSSSIPTLIMFSPSRLFFRSKPADPPLEHASTPVQDATGKIPVLVDGVYVLIDTALKTDAKPVPVADPANVKSPSAPAKLDPTSKTGFRWGYCGLYDNNSNELIEIPLPSSDDPTATQGLATHIGKLAKDPASLQVMQTVLNQATSSPTKSTTPRKQAAVGLRSQAPSLPKARRWAKPHEWTASNRADVQKYLQSSLGDYSKTPPYEFSVAIHGFITQCRRPCRFEYIDYHIDCYWNLHHSSMTPQNRSLIYACKTHLRSVTNKSRHDGNLSDEAYQV